MLRENTDSTFGLAARFFHWASALIVLGLLIVGFLMTSMEFSPQKFQIYMLHKSFGLTVLALVIARIIWRFMNPPPKKLEDHKPWEKTLSNIIHGLLYFGLIAMPMSGWIMSSAGEYPVNFFGLFDMPSLSGKNEALFEISKTLHEAGSFALIAAIGFHFLGAAKHHIIDKDSTLRRMGGNVLTLVVFGLLLAAATIIAGSEFLEEFNETEEAISSPADPSSDQAVSKVTDSQNLWVISTTTSKINFEFQQYGQSTSGFFKDITGTIQFEPENLGTAKADITIPIGTIDTGSQDRNNQARSAEWFDANKFSTAHFVSESFEETQPNQYLVHGQLTIRDKTLPLSFPFTLDIKKNDAATQHIAKMKAEFLLNRLDFGVGQGQWQATDAIADSVKINIELEATQNIGK
jgi:cytochrome b561